MFSRDICARGYQLRGRVESQHLSQRGIRGNELPVRGGLKNSIPRVFKDIAIFPLGLAQRPLRVFAIGDILTDSDARSI